MLWDASIVLLFVVRVMLRAMRAAAATAAAALQRQRRLQDSLRNDLQLGHRGAVSRWYCGANCSVLVGHLYWFGARRTLQRIGFNYSSSKRRPVNLRNSRNRQKQSAPALLYVTRCTLPEIGCSHLERCSYLLWVICDNKKMVYLRGWTSFDVHVDLEFASCSSKDFLKLKRRLN